MHVVAKSCMSEKSLQINEMEFTGLSPEFTLPLTFKKQTLFKFQCPVVEEQAQLSERAVKIVFISVGTYVHLTTYLRSCCRDGTGMQLSSVWPDNERFGKTVDIMLTDLLEKRVMKLYRYW